MATSAPGPPPGPTTVVDSTATLSDESGSSEDGVGAAETALTRDPWAFGRTTNVTVAVTPFARFPRLQGDHGTSRSARTGRWSDRGAHSGVPMVTPSAAMPSDTNT
jgi:hypothetical protein